MKIKHYIYIYITDGVVQSTKQKLNLFSKVKTAKHQMMQALHIKKFIMNDTKKEKFTLKLLTLSAILLRFKLS